MTDHHIASIAFGDPLAAVPDQQSSALLSASITPHSLTITYEAVALLPADLIIHAITAKDKYNAQTIYIPQSPHRALFTDTPGLTYYPTNGRTRSGKPAYNRPDASWFYFRSHSHVATISQPPHSFHTATAVHTLSALATQQAFLVPPTCPATLALHTLGRHAADIPLAHALLIIAAAWATLTSHPFPITQTQPWYPPRQRPINRHQSSSDGLPHGRIPITLPRLNR